LGRETLPQSASGLIISGDIGAGEGGIGAEDCSAVRFFAPFDDFRTSQLPGSVPEYLA
jgi:hypothetical protein